MAVSNKPALKQSAMTIYKGGSLVKVNRSSATFEGRKGGGVRGSVSKFTRQSRKRLIDMLGTLKKSRKPLFVTLTYGDTYPEEIKRSKEHLNTFFKRLERAFPNACIVWKLEPQERGAPHFHLLLWGVEWIDARKYIPVAWYSIAGAGDLNVLKWHRGELPRTDHCVQEIFSWNGVVSYASKYMGKEIENSEQWENAGRYWGVKGRENLPLAEKIVIENLTDSTINDLFRALRKYHDGKRKLVKVKIGKDGKPLNKYKKRRKFYSQTISMSVNNPSQWLRLLRDEDCIQLRKNQGQR